jgi:hypothetical protein
MKPTQLFTLDTLTALDSRGRDKGSPSRASDFRGTVCARIVLDIWHQISDRGVHTYPQNAISVLDYLASDLQAGFTLASFYEINLSSQSYDVRKRRLAASIRSPDLGDLATLNATCISCRRSREP